MTAPSLAEISKAANGAAALGGRPPAAKELTSEALILPADGGSVTHDDGQMGLRAMSGGA